MTQGTSALLIYESPSKYQNWVIYVTEISTVFMGIIEVLHFFFNLKLFRNLFATSNVYSPILTISILLSDKLERTTSNYRKALLLIIMTHA